MPFLPNVVFHFLHHQIEFLRAMVGDLLQGLVGRDREIARMQREIERLKRELTRKDEKIAATSKMLVDAKVTDISCLPDDVINSILSHLPLKEAIATSLLAKAWRYKWMYMPDIVVGEYFPMPEEDEQEEHESKIIHLVNQLLRLHRGNVRKFEGDFYNIPTTILTSWIKILGVLGIQELLLELPINSIQSVFSSLFSCNTLTCLHIHNNILDVPVSFTGLTMQNLNTVVLQHIILEGKGVIRRFILCCPVLQNLSLLDVHADTYEELDIISPTLRKFVLSGYEPVIWRIRFNAPSLVFMNLKLDRNVPNLPDISGGIYPLSELPILEEFVLDGSIKKLFLGTSQFHPHIFPNLKMLTIVSLFFPSEVKAFLSFLSWQSQLEYLDLSLTLPPRYAPCLGAPSPWEVHEVANFEFNNLRILKIRTPCSHVMGFVDFVIENAPQLEEIIIHGSNTCHVYNKLLLVDRTPLKVSLVRPPYINR